MSHCVDACCFSDHMGKSLVLHKINELFSSYLFIFYSSTSSFYNLKVKLQYMFLKILTNHVNVMLLLKQNAGRSFLIYSFFNVVYLIVKCLFVSELFLLKFYQVAYLSIVNPQILQVSALLLNIFCYTQFLKTFIIRSTQIFYFNKICT